MSPYEPNFTMPGSPNFTTVGDPRQVGGQVGAFRPYNPNFTMPGPSYQVPMVPANGPLVAPTAQRVPLNMGMAEQVAPRMLAPPTAQVAPGVMSRMLGLFGPLSSYASMASSIPSMVGETTNALGGSPMAGFGGVVQAVQPDGMVYAPPVGQATAVPTTVQSTIAPVGSSVMEPQRGHPTMQNDPRIVRPAPSQPAPARQVTPAQAAYVQPMPTLREGMNSNIDDATRARAMDFLRLNGLN